MALSFTLLKTFNSGSNASSYTLTSFTRPANQLLELSVTTTRLDGGTPSQPTVTGWDLVASVTFNSIGTPISRITMFRQLLSSPITGTVVINCGETQTLCCASVVAVSGVNTSGVNGANAIRGSAITTRLDSVRALPLTLPAFGSPTNGALYVAAKASTSTFTGDTGWTELDAASASPIRIFSQGIATQDTTVTATWTLSADAHGAAIVIEVVEAGGTDTQSRTFAIFGSSTTTFQGSARAPRTFTIAGSSTTNLQGEDSVVPTEDREFAIAGSSLVEFFGHGQQAAAFGIPGFATVIIHARANQQRTFTINGQAITVFEGIDVSVPETRTFAIGGNATVDFEGIALQIEARTFTIISEAITDFNGIAGTLVQERTFLIVGYGQVLLFGIDESLPGPGDGGVNGMVPVRYVTGQIANVVPVETVLVGGIGVVPVREFVGPDNVVPVRETLETPRVKVVKV